MAQQSQLVPFELHLDGRLVSNIDPAKIISGRNTQSPQISNFATLTNLEYTDAGIQSVQGMSKITTTRHDTHPKINNIFQYVKSNPSETHLLMQAYNSTEDQSRIYRFSTNTPTTGSITASALHTDASGAGDGRFSDAPIGHVVYCNGKETQVWGGLEADVGYFAIFDGMDPASSGAWIKDYTDEVSNNLTDSNNVATLKQVTIPGFNVGVGSVTAYIAGRLPIQGAKFYVGTPNTTIGTMSVYYWDGSTLTPATNVVDNTSSGGITLAQTGSVTFDSTEDTAKVRLIEGIYGYFYRFIWAGADETTTISQVTVDEPFQTLRDFWDGELREVNLLQMKDSLVLYDFTDNVLEDNYDGWISTVDNSDSSNFVDMSAFQTANDELKVGFVERMQGLQVKMLPEPGYTNTAGDAKIDISYWNGSEWVDVGVVHDGTLHEGESFSQTGFITWNPPDEINERRLELQKETPLYYYKLHWDANFDATVVFYYMRGLPAQKKISNYTFSLNSFGRLWLFNDGADEQNKAIKSAVATLNVFNGEDSGESVFIGDGSPIRTAIPIHSRVTGGSKEDILVLKNGSAYIISDTTGAEDKIIINVEEISNRIGCNAPLTLAVSSIGLEFAPLQSKQIAIWQGSGGIYIWDSSSIIPISDPIANYFDQTKPEAIHPSRAHLSKGFVEINNDNHYYHWLFSSKATDTAELDTEMVFDIKRQGWFKVERGTKPLQSVAHIVATDTGVTYAYGTNDDGNIMLLNDGMTWDGQSITSAFFTGDIPLAGNFLTESKLRYLRLITGAKGTTTNSVTVTHYVDGKSTGEEFSMSPARSGYRLAMPIASRNQYGTFHRFSATMTTNDETRGFSPIGLGGWIQPWREVHQ